LCPVTREPEGIRRASNRGVKKRNTEKLRNLYPSPDIDHMIKRKMRRAVHVALVGRKENAYSALVRTP